MSNESRKIGFITEDGQGSAVLKPYADQGTKIVQGGAVGDKKIGFITEDGQGSAVSKLYADQGTKIVQGGAVGDKKIGFITEDGQGSAVLKPYADQGTKIVQGGAVGDKKIGFITEDRQGSAVLKPYADQETKTIVTANYNNSRICSKPVYVNEEMHKNEQYIKPKETKICIYDLKEQILQYCYVRVYDEQIYVLVPQLGIYKRLTTADLNRLINAYFKEEIRKIDNTKVYSEIKKYLLADGNILCYEKEKGIKWVFQNGYLAPNGDLLINDGRYFLTSFLRCDYIPTATCPNFNRFLNNISGGDLNLENLILEVMGYILSLDNSGKCFFTLVDPKDTGKSVFANLIASFFNSDDISALNPQKIGEKFALIDIKDKRLNLCMDLTNGRLSPACVGVIKMLTGNDLLRSDVKYKDSIAFTNSAKMLFGTNHMIQIEGEDEAFYARQIVLPFINQIPAEHQNRNLLELLESEKSGILLRVMQAYERLQLNNYVFTKCQQVLPENLEFDNETIIKSFCAANCRFEQNKKEFTETLYQAYLNFAISKNVSAVSKKDFSEIFNRLYGNKVERKKIRINDVSMQGYVGVCLCSVT